MRGLILSAGLGERLRPLTLKRAKPAVEFLNMPMLAFPYFWFDSVGLSDITFNTHYLPDSVRKAAMHVVNPNTQLHISHEDEILGSGGGIWNARFHLQGEADFAVANGDGVVTFNELDTIEQMLKFHREKKALATLLVCPLEGVGTKIPGVWLDKYGEVSNFGKTPKKDYLHCLHYASYIFFSERLWNYLPEGESNILYDVLEPAIAAGEKVYGFEPPGMRWFETGNANDYLAATRACLEFMRDGHPHGEGLERMLERFAPDYTKHSDLKQMRLIDDSATIEAKADFSGFNVVGREAQVGGYRLKDCVVLPEAKITANHSLEAVI